MTQEEEQLLLRDLCARLPYGVKISVPSWDGEKQECIDKVDVLYSVNRDGYIKSTNEDYDFSLEDIKPYLFPLSGMSEEQKLYLEWHTKYRLDDRELVVKKDEDGEYLNTNMYDYLSLIEWLNKNHFDYQDLIERGLAIDATGLNIY